MHLHVCSRKLSELTFTRESFRSSLTPPCSGASVKRPGSREDHRRALHRNATTSRAPGVRAMTTEGPFTETPLHRERLSVALFRAPVPQHFPTFCNLPF